MFYQPCPDMVVKGDNWTWTVNSYEILEWDEWRAAQVLDT